MLTAPATATSGDAGVEDATTGAAPRPTGAELTTGTSMACGAACDDEGCPLGGVIHEGGADAGGGGRDDVAGTMAGLSTTNDAADGSSAASGSTPTSLPSGNPQVCS